MLNVKASLMDKLCRFLQADPMFSIDDLVRINAFLFDSIWFNFIIIIQLRKPKLGFASNFYVKNYKLANNKIKPLMFFEGTPTNLGCTILLFGGSLNELIVLIWIIHTRQSKFKSLFIIQVVKSIVRFMIYAAYNSKLEQSFIIDKYADYNMNKSNLGTI